MFKGIGQVLLAVSDFMFGAFLLLEVSVVEGPGFGTYNNCELSVRGMPCCAGLACSDWESKHLESLLNCCPRSQESGLTIYCSGDMAPDDHFHISGLRARLPSTPSKSWACTHG